MARHSFLKSASIITALAVMIFAGMTTKSTRVRAGEGDDDRDEARVRRGFQIAPVPLNLAGKNRALVGLGSYIMNAASDCNSCHNGGQPPDFDFLPGHNPYQFIPGTNLPQPKTLNPAVYLGGGQVFGTADGGPVTADNPLIIS